MNKAIVSLAVLISFRVIIAGNLQNGYYMPERYIAELLQSKTHFRDSSLIKPIEALKVVNGSLEVLTYGSEYFPAKLELNKNGMNQITGIILNYKYFSKKDAVDINYYLVDHPSKPFIIRDKSGQKDTTVFINKINGTFSIDNPFFLEKAILFAGNYILLDSAKKLLDKDVQINLQRTVLSRYFSKYSFVKIDIPDIANKGIYDICSFYTLTGETKSYAAVYQNGDIYLYNFAIVKHDYKICINGLAFFLKCIIKED